MAILAIFIAALAAFVGFGSAVALRDPNFPPNEAWTALGRTWLWSVLALAVVTSTVAGAMLSGLLG